MKKSTLITTVFIVIGILFGAGTALYNKKTVEKAEEVQKMDQSVFQREHSPVYGNPNAKVTITEFLDPACETCRDFYVFVKRLVDSYKGNVKVVVRYAPFHHGVEDVVKVLEASKKQNKYWETMMILYQYQPQWAIHHRAEMDKVWPILKKSGLDIQALKAEMNSPEIAKAIAQDVADLKTLGVRKTPGFFVNGKPLMQFGYQQLIDLVKSEVAKQYK